MVQAGVSDAQLQAPPWQPNTCLATGPGYRRDVSMTVHFRNIEGWIAERHYSLQWQVSTLRFLTGVLRTAVCVILQRMSDKRSGMEYR